MLWTTIPRIARMWRRVPWVPSNALSSNFCKATKPPAIGRLIGDNPTLRLGLNEFIAQKDPALAQQIKENPALFEAALKSVDGDDTGGSSLFNPKMRFLSRKTMLQVRIPYPLISWRRPSIGRLNTRKRRLKRYVSSLPCQSRYLTPKCNIRQYV